VAGAVACIRARARAGTGSVAVDLEGVDLGASGEICIIQCSTARRGAPIWLFDVVALGGALFAPGGGGGGGEGGESLRDLLEDASLPKLLWDVRSDVNALFFLFGVRPRGLVDLQLADVAQRKLAGVPCAKVAGLGFVCERTPHARLTAAERERLAAVKAGALRLFAPEKGGTYSVWKARPLPAELLEYCTDSCLFFSLWASYVAEVPALAAGGAFSAALDAAVARRLELAMTADWETADKQAVIGIDAAFLADLEARGARFPAPPPPPAQAREQRRSGDWDCAQCAFVGNFGRNTACHRCGAQKPLGLGGGARRGGGGGGGGAP